MHGSRGWESVADGILEDDGCGTKRSLRLLDNLCHRLKRICLHYRGSACCGREEHEAPVLDDDVAFLQALTRGLDANLDVSDLQHCAIAQQLSNVYLLFWNRLRIVEHQYPGTVVALGFPPTPQAIEQFVAVLATNHALSVRPIDGVSATLGDLYADDRQYRGIRPDEYNEWSTEQKLAWNVNHWVRFIEGLLCALDDRPRTVPPLIARSGSAPAGGRHAAAGLERATGPLLRRLLHRLYGPPEHGQGTFVLTVGSWTLMDNARRARLLVLSPLVPSLKHHRGLAATEQEAVLTLFGARGSMYKFMHDTRNTDDKPLAAADADGKAFVARVTEDDRHLRRLLKASIAAVASGRAHEMGLEPFTLTELTPHLLRLTIAAEQGPLYFGVRLHAHDLVALIDRADARRGSWPRACRALWPPSTLLLKCAASIALRLGGLPSVAPADVERLSLPASLWRLVAAYGLLEACLSDSDTDARKRAQRLGERLAWPIMRHLWGDDGTICGLGENATYRRRPWLLVGDVRSLLGHAFGGGIAPWIETLSEGEREQQ